MPSALDQWSRDVTVLVVGDVMLDRYTEGDVYRVSPEAPVPVVVRRTVTVSPGGAANAAANIASLGCRAELVGFVGKGDDGNELLDAVVLSGVGARGLVSSAMATSVKHRIVAAGQQIVRVDTEPMLPFGPDEIDRLVEEFAAVLPHADAVLISDYAKGVCTRGLCTEVIGAAVEAGVPVVVDPKANDFSIYRGASVVTPNLAEARAAAGVDVTTVREIGRHLARLSGGAVVITLGAEGMCLFRGDDEDIHLPAKARHVYDVTGAGDTVAAVVAVSLAQGMALPDACSVANEAAAIAVSRRGTVRVTHAELLEAVEGRMS